MRSSGGTTYGTHRSVGAQRADRILEIGRHDADDLVGATFERDRASDDAGVAAEPAAPQPIAENDDPMSAVDFVLGGERPADAGRTRSTSKKPAVTRCARRSSGSAPGSRSVTAPPAIAAIDSNTCCCATQST